MDPIKVDFSGKKESGGKGKNSKAAVVTPSKAGLKTIISIVAAVIGAVIAYYFMLPALNFKSTDLYLFLGVIAVIYIAAQALLSGMFRNPEMGAYVKKKAKIPGIIIAALVVIVGIGFLISAVIFRANSYNKLIDVDENKTFAADISEADFQSVPVLDSAASAALANRTLGDLASINAVSQFEVSEQFTQINYKNSPVRVTTLAYGDIFKWLKNTSKGFPGYIIVNMVTQKAELVKLDEGNYIRYSTEEHFQKYLMRHLRFKYPTYIFDTPHFEIDEQGQPFWICPVLDKTIGIFGGTDVKGMILVNAITGECTEYSKDDAKDNKELQWIDGLYSSSLLIEQYNYHGKYINGFINSIIGQEGVKVTTEGYNYLAMNDDVYLYTGVTSTNSDQAIIGFVLVNMRTKDANFYSVSGAKEYSAASSAEGAVQNYAYTATFPILLNINGQATYFMSLKDSSNLVKRYGMVNVQNYQVVVTGSTIADCIEEYVKALKENNINIKVDIDQIKEATEDIDQNDTDDGEASDETDAEDKTASITAPIADIRTAVIDGESIYYIRLEGSKKFFSIKASDFEKVVILDKGDELTIVFDKSDEAIIPAKSVK